MLLAILVLYWIVCGMGAAGMRPGDTIKLEIPVATEYVSIVRKAAEQAARHLKFHDCEIDDIKLAVGEACTNAVRHADSNDSQSVYCEIRLAGETMEIEIRNGVASDETPVVPEKPDTSCEGGYGLYLMHSLMDSVDLDWNSKTATIKMTKKLGKDEAA